MMRTHTFVFLAPLFVYAGVNTRVIRFSLSLSLSPQHQIDFFIRRQSIIYGFLKKNNNNDTYFFILCSLIHTHIHISTRVQACVQNL